MALTIVGFTIALYVLLILVSFVLFWFKKPNMNAYLSKTWKKAIKIFVVLLFVAAILDATIFKDLPPAYPF